jgi:hypothetical protein
MILHHISAIVSGYISAVKIVCYHFEFFFFDTFFYYTQDLWYIAFVYDIALYHGIIDTLCSLSLVLAHIQNETPHGVQDQRIHATRFIFRIPSISNSSTMAVFFHLDQCNTRMESYRPKKIVSIPVFAVFGC